jgi:hypothetical protein
VSQTARDPETSPGLSASCGGSAQGVHDAAEDGHDPMAPSLDQRLGVRLGLVTFLRLVQSSMKDVAYAHRIALLREFDVRVSPELGPHLLLVRGSRAAALLHREGLAPSGWQLTLTTAGMVAVVNSVVVAAVAGPALPAASLQSLAVSLAFGAVVGAGALTRHQRHHRRVRDAYTPEGVDRAAIFVPSSPQADTA